MIKSLQQLLAGIPVKKVLGPTNLPIHTLCFDSRKVVVGVCFVAINGSQVDGHLYIEMAIAAGSHAIVCERLPQSIQAAVTYIVVASTPHALGMMAANFYDHPSKKLKVVAVTGTNGKTTVVHLLYNMATKMGYKAGMLSTIYNKVLDQTYPASHTTPDALQLQSFLHLMVAAGCSYCFIEASSHAIVQERLAGIDFTGAIFTNITHDHLDYHPDFLHYIQAKKKLFDGLPPTAFALMNQQDRNSSILVQNCKAKRFTFSLQDAADFRAKIVANTLDGLELEIGHQSVWFQLMGAFNASNLLAAYGTAQLLGLSSWESLVALSAIPPILGRMNRVSQQVIIDYAHTPDAIQKVIVALRAMLPVGTRLITIMGCGGNRDQQKRAMIGKILSENSDIAIFTSDNPRDEDPQEIIHAMQQGVAPAAKVLHIINRAMAIRTACYIAHPNDLILIAGKGHQYYEEIQGVQHFFCEAQIVQEILGE
ncbi:UDP-N-acetylmuramyl-tripeptide synthetase [Cardinium endosymbiont of Sogatella furcifera]|uniref:UDP-N-acetylmuramoyl-L-alanyl-D-glutamate--2, 6-diaminopimelate ligase n=1 Tax=Cardinium endosymbiont of Sogatella furcifera TaxID=650378 RepID=UPI000E1057B2|nr:UDP-N-acetylmuramoyl-L-alanyl-D-glutamate--2,6-diaminopimelate ligase [Cardinium endosymbiont of Sogatella furcifera]AXI24178.1 UDP-N-acetylmuramyl-tripeptide synthetase [Cardinium endosymbiont of Sogatella furcifera]